MRNIYLSGVALAALLLAASPASAQLLNLGGGGGSGIGIDLGGGSGDGGLLDLGGGSNGGAESNSSVDIDLGGIDLDDDGVLDGTLIDIDGDGDADLIDLDGDGIGDQQVDIDLFGVGENGETQLAVGTDGNDEVIVNLFGASGQGETATANILPGGSDNLFSDKADEAAVELGGNNAIVDLFGSGGSDDTARVAINPGGDGTDAAVDLFGPDGGSGGTGVDPTETGSMGGGTGNGGDGTGGLFAPNGGSATRVATVNARRNVSCFSPTDEQIAHLLGRNSYSAGVAASWQNASDVNLVEIELCPDARAQLAAALAASPNIGLMQAAVASSRLITAELAPQYGVGNVLAVDKSGSNLIVYVY